MRAALIHQCGAPPTLVERAAPVPPDDHLTVRVTAASITPLDLLCATGTSYFGTPATPYVPGVQGVGELADGTAVWFATTAGMRPGDGSMAEYAIVRPADIVPLPAGVDHRLIAALGLSAVAALMALTWRGGLQPGEQVLVLGAGGIVGQAGIQLSLLNGARRVIAACRSESSARRALDLGATEVVRLQSPLDAGSSSSVDDRPPASSGDGPERSLDGRPEPSSDDRPRSPFDGRDVEELAGRLRAAADGPVDLVLDPLFGVPAAAALRTLRPGGRLVNLGSSAGATAPLDSATLRGGSLSVLGYTNNDLTTDQRADSIGVIAEHVHAGRLTVDYEAVPLDEVSTAWHRQATGQTARRLVLLP